ncbi:hypothetical protein YT1_4421 [Rhodococcus ruber]|nr:hypothetical protein YT1_4421 [Rhodococcus ruber]
MSVLTGTRPNARSRFVVDVPACGDAVRMGVHIHSTTFGVSRIPGVS